MKRVVRMEGGSEALVVILSSCVVVVLSCHQVVIMVPGVSELGWDELGTGGAHCSLFGCHITGGLWHLLPLCPLAISVCVGVHWHLFWGAQHC